MQQAVAGYKYQTHRYKQNIHNETNNNKGWYNDYAQFAAFSLYTCPMKTSNIKH